MGYFLTATGESIVFTAKYEGSEKMESTIVFKCPSCKGIFEFDPVGENELVSCPICGNDFGTVKNGENLKLEPLGFDSKLELKLRGPFSHLKLTP